MTDYSLGTRLIPDDDTRMISDDLLWGGSPSRVMRLSLRGREALAELLDGPVRSAAGARLARRLTDAGLLHPMPSAAWIDDVTVVVPVRDRAEDLDRCLKALGGAHPVIVVDDASADPAAIQRVCGAHGAQLIRRNANGGPAAARNTAFAVADSEYVLLLDSDCVPPPDLVKQLSGVFADSLVGAVAPRIRPLPDASAPGRYAMIASSLDLGDRTARVAPGSRVSYVPTAALLVRRTAIEAVGGFDEDLRVGEDVDLVWRLDAAGWRVRYEPSVVVQHDEPATWRALLGRRFRYGTSAGPLARQHPGQLAPVVLHTWSALAVAAVLARRPGIAIAALAASTTTLRKALREAGVDADGVTLEAVRAAGQTWRQTGRVATQFAPPLLAAAMIGRRHRLMIAALVLANPVSEWLRGPRAMNAASYTAARIADDAAYGAGVVTGALRHRTAGPLRVVVVRRLLRIPPRTLRPVTTPRPATVVEERALHV